MALGSRPVTREVPEDHSAYGTLRGRSAGAQTFPKAHRQQLHRANPLERLNAEIKRRTEVVWIFPTSQAITRLIGAMLLEQNDEW